MTALAGLEVLEAPFLRDGTIISTPGRVMVGTRPLTDLELAGAQARHLVRIGLCDVLDWLGMPIGRTPARSGVGAKMLDTLQQPDVGQAAGGPDSYRSMQHGVVRLSASANQGEASNR